MTKRLKHASNRSAELLNFICLTCDGIFSYLERVHDPRANKLGKTNQNFPIMCKECFKKSY